MIYASEVNDMITTIFNLIEPDAVIHVGAGRGNGPMHDWQKFKIEKALLIDADKTRLDWLESRKATFPEWHALGAILDADFGSKIFYRANNPTEDGLLSPDYFTTIWPKLSQVQKLEKATCPLDMILNNDVYSCISSADAILLVVDCLPCVRILQGATETLNRCSLVWARVLLDALPSAQESSLSELKDFLEPLGFRLVQVIDGNHPQIGEALFVRSLKVATKKNSLLSTQNAFLQTACGELEKKETTLFAELCESQAEKERLRRDLCTYAQHNERLSHHVVELQQEVVSCKKINEELSDTGITLRSQAEALSVENAQVIRQAADSQRSYGECAGSLEDLEHLRDVLQSEVVAHLSVRMEQATEIEVLKIQVAESALLQNQINILQAEIGAHLSAREDEAAVVESLREQLTAHISENNRLQAECASLMSLRDQIEHHFNEIKSLGHHRDILQAEIAKHLQAREDEAVIVNEMTAGLIKLESELYLANGNIRDLQSTYDELQVLHTSSLSETEVLRDMVEIKKRELDESRSENCIVVERNLQLESELSILNKKNEDDQEKYVEAERLVGEKEARQKILNDEILRAEAQLDLIKDILLRDVMA